MSLVSAHAILQEMLCSAQISKAMSMIFGQQQQHKVSDELYPSSSTNNISARL